ncbi:MAG: sensor histidine kinase [Herbinix sp.]|nr:sensor histidine kinase [Herbinix sp.]
MRKFSFNNYKIRTKMLLIYCFCVLMPIIFTDAIILYTMNSNYKENRMRDHTYVIERVKSNLSDTIDSCILFTYNLYSDEMLDKFLSKQYINHLDYYEDYMNMKKYNSLSYNYNYGRLYKIITYADNETLVNGGSIAKLETAKEEEWYKEFLESGQDIFLYTYYDVGKKNVPGSGTSRTISIIRKLDYFDKRGMSKILKVDLDYSNMLKDVLNEKLDGEIYVRNKEFILFSNLFTASGTREYESADMIRTEDATTSISFQTGFEEWEILIKAKDVPFWSVIFENKWLLSIVLINIFLPSILIYFVGKSISRRLMIITSYMGKVEKEQFELIEINEGEDEIGKLIKRFNLMVLRIKELIEVVFKGQAEKQDLELAKKNAELKAVQSQVNPHFLFNTLESIRMRSLIKNEHETADIIEELAILFRKTMSWGDDYISVEEEMGFIDNYIHIQRYRFGDKIKYYHYIMDECRTCLVPKLSISTFIENACIHGIETSDKEGVISLTITKSEEFLLVEITDNGKGMDEYRLNELKRMINHADSSMLYESKSTGVLNAYLRLKMYSDGNVLFDIDSKPEGGTEILIRLPLAYSNKEQNPIKDDKEEPFDD